MSLFISKRRFLVVAFLLAMTIANLFLLFLLIPKLQHGYQDFTIFYTGARLLRSGQASSLYNLATQYQMQQTFTQVPIRHGPLPFNHPPFEALLFIPFTFLPYWTAYLLWTALNFIMLAAIVILLRKHFSQLAQIPLPVFGLAAIAFFPLAIGLLQGQDIIFFLLLFVSATICLDQNKDQNKDALAGLLLGAALFRPQTAVPLVILLAARRWKVLIGFIPVALVLLGISVALLGWRGPFDYVHFVTHIDGTNTSAFGPEAVPNLRGLVQELPLINSSRPGPHLASALLLLVSSLLVFLLAWRRIRNGGDSIIFSASLAAATTILICFHALVYDFTLLFPMVLFILARILGSNAKALEFDNTLTNEARLGSLEILIFILLFLTPVYIYLLLIADRFFCYSLILLTLYVKLLRAPSPAEVPA
jgi:hypothetical protein